jgi:PleD family two-component response regulator
MPSHEYLEPHFLSTKRSIRRISSIARQQKLRILMVDDQIFNLIILEEILLNFKYIDIVKASNGQEAIEKVLENKGY